MTRSDRVAARSPPASRIAHDTEPHAAGMNSYRPIPVPFRLTGQDLLHTGFEPVAADAKQGEIFKAIRINAGMFQSSYMSVRPQQTTAMRTATWTGIALRKTNRSRARTPPPLRTRSQMRFFVEKKLFNDELMNSFLANDNECTHDFTELDHLAPLGQVKEIYEHEVATVEKFKVVMRSNGRRYTVTPQVIASVKSMHAKNRLTRPPDLSSSRHTSFKYYECPSGVDYCNGRSQCCIECREAFQRPSDSRERKAAAEVKAIKPHMDYNCPWGCAWCNCRSSLCANCLKDKGWSVASPLGTSAARLPIPLFSPFPPSPLVCMRKNRKG